MLLNVDIICVLAVVKLRSILEQLFNKTLFLKFWFSYREEEKIAAFLLRAVMYFENAFYEKLLFFLSVWGGHVKNQGIWWGFFLVTFFMPLIETEQLWTVIQNTKMSKMNHRKIFVFSCAQFLTRQPHLKLLKGKNISICKLMIPTVWHFSPSACLIKQIQTSEMFFLGILEILWIKEMENLISWFYAGVKDMAGKTAARWDIY